MSDQILTNDLHLQASVPPSAISGGTVSGRFSPSALFCGRD